ncbi:MAG: hypothetical protein EPN88_10345 [Bacteroidetes bacterium]|nr:MAG: hypothetical protein EPN88_10345 [Bacteroidota bacterium]
MPLRIDSECRKENADASISFILSHFETTIIVVEGDLTRNYYPDFKTRAFHYEFLKDTRLFFHKTRYINRLIELTVTPFIAVWDADAIVPVEQILESAEVLRMGETVMSIPYDGRVFICDQYLSDLFRSHPKIELFLKLAPSLPLMYGYHSTGGAFMADNQKYLETGGENENFHGWGPEDAERVKRLEIMNLPIHNSEGPLFHFWHPRGQNSWYADSRIEIQNRREFIETCKKTGFK